MSSHRARETGHGLGFALIALGLAVAPLAGFEVFPGVFGLGMAGAGAVLLAVASRLGPAANGASWTHDRSVGFFSGVAAFWLLFLVTGSSVGGLGPVPAGPGTPDDGLRTAAEHMHVYRLDPSGYLALGAPPASTSPAWTVANGTVRVDGVAAWNETSGLTRLHVSLEGWVPGRGWVEQDRWTLAPGEAFSADLDTDHERRPELLRLALLPDASAPVFQPVDVQAGLTLLAP